MSFTSFLLAGGFAYVVNPLVLSLVGLGCVLAAWAASGRFHPATLRKHANGRHVLVTGGSKGLGKAAAAELAQAGARVTIVARGKDVDSATGKSSLDAALEELRTLHSDPSFVRAYAVDLSDYPAVVSFVRSLRGAAGMPDWLVAAAGSATPGYLADQLPADGKREHAHDWLMSGNYTASVNIVRAVVQVAKETGAATSADAALSVVGLTPEQQALMPERIVFVGSMLSLMSFVGYSAYSASKYALQGLAEGLRSEFKPLGTKVHVYLPGNMDTPGHVIENSTKPKITAELEGASTLVTPRDAAQFMFASMLNDRYIFSNDLLGELVRVSASTSAPRPNPVFEIMATPLIAIIFSAWVAFADFSVAKYFRNKAASI